MNIWHAFPVADPLMLKWPKLSKHNMFANINECDYIFCASVTQLRRAFYERQQAGSKVPIVGFVWDLPTNWRSWCKTEQDYMDNAGRDGDISMKLDLLYKCHRVISASKATQTALNMCGIKSDVLWHFYDAESLDAVKAGEKKNRIIQISRYALNKRFDLTLEAWRKLQDKYPDWELMFIGYGNADKFRCLARELGVERFTALENATHIERIQLMKESKILVSPSLNEGFGLSPFEAQHCGLCTVCSKIPTTTEFGYNNGIFNPDDINGYVDSISHYIEHPVKWSGTTREDLLIDAWVDRFDNYMEEL